ncbi:MAG: AraC family transcriptional regulator [Bacteroidia bacterium]
MTTQQKIKDGLYYNIKTLYVKRANNSLLKKHADSISLFCEFSGFDCSFAFGDTAISYDIEFIFYHEYLESFSPVQSFDLDQLPEQQHEVCCNTQMILHEIINCKLQGAFRNMFLESKALSLLLCFQKCSTANQTDCASCKFLTKPVEKEKILKAKEIILSRLNNPPTIPELSIETGINQCYLKKGFKELFGSTVYDFVQEQRMLKAKLLLKTTDLTLSQVAEQIGFSGTGNFSSAFKKFTGIFPSELQQN